MSRFYRQYGKRALDLALAIPGSIALAPGLVAVAALVRVIHGKPVLFRQQRPGKAGKPFFVYKFRTMREAVDMLGQPLPDAVRLTPLGRFLRNTSLDELPELLNVLKGEMSLVGPRPLLMHYLERYSSEQRRRHELAPGMTGWAQVHGRNALSWEEKFELDVWYVDHASLWLDLQILARTVLITISREGIHAPNHATVGEFQGSLDCHAGAG